MQSSLAFQILRALNIHFHGKTTTGQKLQNSPTVLHIKSNNNAGCSGQRKVLILNCYCFTIALSQFVPLIGQPTAPEYASNRTEHSLDYLVSILLAHRDKGWQNIYVGWNTLIHNCKPETTLGSVSFQC